MVASIKITAIKDKDILLLTDKEREVTNAMVQKHMAHLETEVVNYLNLTRK